MEKELKKYGKDAVIQEGFPWEEELKTLKDINTIFLKIEDEGMPHKIVEAYQKELKQEAIKDIRELQKIEEIDMIKVPIEKQDEIEKKYFTLFDAVGAYDNSNVIDYIKWKFNITEEDLKGGKK